MNFDFDTLIFRLPAIVIALTVHEFAHGRVAYAFGDATAKEAGRLTLNPLRHLDVFGTLALIFFGFGWAKPVPVNPYYFQGNRGHKVICVSVAGPLSNLAQSLVASGLLSLLLHLPLTLSPTLGGWLFNFLLYLILINLVLAIFNILPVPPLDGSKVLAGLLPERHMNILFSIERYGFIILIALMWLGWLDKILIPLRSLLFTGLMRLVDLGYLPSMLGL